MTHPLIAVARQIASEVAAVHAPSVDAAARFPAESVAAMKKARLLSAAVPTEWGGEGCTLQDLGTICSSLAQGCGSSAMVLAMHYSQLACLVRHAGQSAYFRRYLTDLCQHQYLLASMTSEVGTFGDTRTSVCAVEPAAGGRFDLTKDATTGSYCSYADAILVTCRRAADAPGNDQVLVLVQKSDCTLTQTTSWDTLGMRGTCSPGFKLVSSGSIEQIVPGAFADSSAQSMVPYSHVLWSSLWCGIASDAVRRAATFVRAEARKKPGTVPPAATRLATLYADLQVMRSGWQSLAREFDQLPAGDEGAQQLMGIGWALKLNNLKVSASEAGPRLVHQALQITGVLGYKNDSPFSVGRHYRDLLSGSLMISNERIAAKSASMLLVFKDDAL